MKSQVKVRTDENELLEIPVLDNEQEYKTLIQNFITDKNPQKTIEVIVIGQPKEYTQSLKTTKDKIHVKLSGIIKVIIPNIKISTFYEGDTSVRADKKKINLIESKFIKSNISKTHLLDGGILRLTRINGIKKPNTNIIALEIFKENYYWVDSDVINNQNISIWKQGRWLSNGESTDIITARAVEYGLIPKQVKDVIALIRSMAKHKSSKNMIHVGNGILDITADTIKFNPSTPNYKNTQFIPTLYDPKAISPKYDKLLTTITSDPIKTQNLKNFGADFISALCKNNIRLNKFFIFFGFGKNSKSSLINIYAGILGSDMVITMPLDHIENHRFAIPSLIDKLLIIIEEAGEELKKSDNTRKIIDHTELPIEQKGQSIYHKKYNGAIIQSLNKLSTPPDTSDGHFRRHKLFNFTHKVEKPILNFANLVVEEEASGILNHWINDYQQVLKDGIFIDNESENTVREEWTRINNPVYNFMRSDFCLLDSELSVSNKLFKFAVKKYCDFNSITRPSKLDYGTAYEDLGIIIESRTYDPYNQTRLTTNFGVTLNYEMFGVNSIHELEIKDITKFFSNNNVKLKEFIGDKKMICNEFDDQKENDPSIKKLEEKKNNE